MIAVSLHDRIRGCLLGGAIGDALGAPVEFLSLAAILARYGPGGPAEFDRAYGVVGAVTDDTQMTLFTAEGLLRAHVRAGMGDVFDPASVVHRSYLRWLHTQDGRVANSALGPHPENGFPDGWLVGVEALRANRAPGATCLSALRSGRMGTPGEPVNDSKGCGGVMRAAPVGLVGAGDPFGLACDIAATTHGHPSGYLSAGVLAAIVHRIIFDEMPLEAAVDAAEADLIQYNRHEETLGALRNARALVARGQVNAEAIEAELGGGWVGEEALAIALACALAYEHDAERALRVAVTHSGDSDSTGAICGNLLGALHGPEAFPQRWREAVELRDVIEALADDLHTAATGGTLSPERYPGW